ncbi:MAG: nuclear transport factor 2 family protein [Rhodospirillales bacterium]|nr:nuclear transport factor 2 family protein [Acetobacter sp.]
MSYTNEEQRNLHAVQQALNEAADDFAKLAGVFADNIQWTIVGHGPVARTFDGMRDLLENGENALFQRISGHLKVTSKGVWANEDKVFVHMTSAGQAIDKKPYRNEYMYILTMEDGKAVACTAWLDLYAYYEIIERIRL